MWRPKPRSAHLRTRATALAIGLLLLATGCSDEDESSGLDARAGKAITAVPEDPSAAEPAVGTCHLLDPGAVHVVVDTTPPLPDCSGEHTSRTFHVQVVEAATTTPLEEIAAQACAEAFSAGTGLGEDQLLGSFLTWLWFEPTAEQRAAGADWLRCDVVATVDGTTLLPLPTGTPDSDPFGGTVDATYQRCIRNGGDTDGDGRDEAIHVTCAEAHDFEWSGAFTVETGAHPTDAEFFARAQQACPTITGTEDWWSTWPSAHAWAGGEHRVSCFAATRE